MDSDSLVISAPGKIILHGEHSVVYGKTAVALSLNMRTVLTATHNSSMYLELGLSSQGTKKWSIQDLVNLKISIPGDPQNPVDLNNEDLAIIQHFLATNEEALSVIDRVSLAFIFLVKAVYLKLPKCTGLGFDVSSCLPIGAGLGSSASIAVCLAGALLKLEGALTLTDMEDILRSDSEYNHTFHLTSTALDLVNRWAFVVEKIFHGNPSGVDNCTCTYGGAVIYRNGQFNPMKVNLNLRILVVNSMVSRNTKEIVSRVKCLKEKYPCIIEPILDAMDQIACLFEATLQDTLSSKSDDHFYNVFEDLIDLNHALLNAINVGHPKLEQIITTSHKYGFHAKLTGAGGGGVAFVLLRPGTPHKNVEALKENFIQQGLQWWEVNIGGSGLQMQASILKEM